MPDATIESAREYARIALVAVVPVLIVALQSEQIDGKAVGILAAVAVLKAVDRALHETRVEEQGLVRF